MILGTPSWGLHLLPWLCILCAACAGSGLLRKSGDAEAATCILHGGRILTLDAGRPVVQAMSIRNGRILALGSRADVGTGGEGAVEIDLKGGVVIPALVDHHVHVLNVGLSLLNAELNEALFLDLSGAASIDEIADRVAARAAALPPGTWILGKGWSQGAWGARELPSHASLSRSAPQHPVYLTRLDAHAAWLNAAALEIAGIDAGTPNPRGGAILRQADGSPSGILLECANDLVLPLLPKPSDVQIRRAFRMGADIMAAQGITRVYDGGFLAMPGIVGLKEDLAHVLDLLRQEDAAEPLPVEIYLMAPAPSGLADALIADPAKYRGISPRLHMTHIKLFCDGAMGSRGAALTHPYFDDPATMGVYRMTEEELLDQTLRALDAGLDVSTHAIGDGAVDRVLNAYEKALNMRAGIKPERLRIEHFSYASSGDIERAARLRVLLSIQPNFVAPGNEGGTMEDSRIGSANCDRAYPWGRLLQLGACLGGGSDYFTAPGHPLLNYYSAAFRKNPEGLPKEGWKPGQKLPRLQALRLFTDFHPPGGGAAQRGTLRAGGPADLTVISIDPLEAAEDEILESVVHATLLDGRVTYTDGKLAGLKQAW